VDAAETASEVPPIGLPGAHMRENAAVSLALLRALAKREPKLRVEEDAVRRAFADVRWPGRLEVVHARPLVILDGAHNREGAEALAAALPSVAQPPFRLLFAAMADKPWREIALILLPMIDEATVVSLREKRAVPIEELRTAFAPHVPTRMHDRVDEAMEQMLAGDSPVVVMGSLFLVGAVYGWLLQRSGRRSVYQRESAFCRERVA
jgi:dihydrofolate synthase/folylpolyglutamate synthase